MNGVLQHVTIRSVGEFELALRDLPDHCIYRGEDAAGYPLRPRVGRFATVEHTVEMEREMLEEFKTRARALLAAPPAGDWGWLALGHQHGLATRFLDWTTNPLMAAFWAVQEPHRGGDRVVYVLDRSGIPAGPDRGASPFDPATVTLYQPTHADVPFPSPCGVLTAHPDPVAAFAVAGMRRWVLKAEALASICMTVDGLGPEGEECCYADLGFLCRKLNWDRELEVLADAAPVVAGGRPRPPARRRRRRSPA